MYIVLCCQGEGLRDVRVLVDIEDAPDLIVRPPSTSVSFVSLCPLRLNCVLD
jgi:hypothetical protein